MKRKYSTTRIHLLREKNPVKTIGQKPVKKDCGFIRLIQVKILQYRKYFRTATDLPDQEKRVSVGHNVYQLYSGRAANSGVCLRNSMGEAPPCCRLLKQSGKQAVEEGKGRELYLKGGV